MYFFQINSNTLTFSRRGDSNETDLGHAYSKIGKNKWTESKNGQ